MTSTTLPAKEDTTKSTHACPICDRDTPRIRKYCSHKCAARGRYATSTIQATCLTCGKLFSLPKSEYDRRIRQNDGKIYCSRKCIRRGRNIKEHLLEYINTHPKEGKWSQTELARILGCTRESIRLIKNKEHLDTYIRGKGDQAHFCPVCKTKIEFYRPPSGGYCYPKFCSTECRKKEHLKLYIELTCHTCKKKFLKRLFMYRRDSKTKRTPYWFCSHKCNGVHTGKNYGFAQHPKNIFPRKYDYDAVAKLTAEGHIPREISNLLNIPLPSLYGVRSKLKLPKRTTRKYDYDAVVKLAKEECTVKEIAEKLGASQGAIYKILHKAGILKQRIKSKCTGCGKPITKKKAKQFDNQCESCWYKTQQERALNEETE